MRRRTTRACYGSISNGSRDDISVAGKCGRSLCEQNFAARTGDAGDIHGDRPAHLRARRLSPACRLALPPPAGKKSPATANFLFDAQPNLFGIACQIKKSANFVHGLFAYRLAERRGFEPLKPFRGLLAFQAGQFNHSCTFPRIKKKNQPSDRLILCGERGIRTPGTVARTPHFECGPIDHSGISPKSPRNGEAPPSGPVGSDVYHPFGAANINKISQIVLFHDKKVVRKRKFAPRTHRSVQYPRPAHVYINEIGQLSKIIPTFVRKPFRY